MLIIDVIYVTLLVSFVITLLEKWGIREQVQMRAPKIVSDMFGCDFCLSFWLSVVISLTFLLFSGKWDCLLIPFFSAPLFRLLP